MDDRNKSGKKAGYTGITINIILAAAKLTVGFLFNSIAMVADGVNNLSDTASSAITILGFKLSEKPADKKHPYGHARMEYISALMISFVVVFLGLQLLISSIRKIFNPDPIEFSYLSVVILIFSIAVKIFLWIYYKRAGEKIKSPVLIAASLDSRNDIFATSAILISIIIFYFTGIDLDGIIGGVVALLILYFGVKLTADTVNPLLGAAPPKKFTDKIGARIMSYNGILGFHDLAVHNYGYKRSFASVHCEVSADEDVVKSHELIDKIERYFLENMNLQMVIHVDPVILTDVKVNHAKSVIEKIAVNISEKIDIHDFRAVSDRGRTKYVFDISVPYNFEPGDNEISDKICEETLKFFPDSKCVITIDHY